MSRLSAFSIHALARQRIFLLKCPRPARSLSMMPSPLVSRHLPLSVNFSSSAATRPIVRLVGTTRSAVADPLTRSDGGTALTWVDKHVPLALQPFCHLARLDRPIGTWLLLWPCLWSTALSPLSGHMPDLKLMALFTVGAFVMRGAGCTINDMWDRDIDSKVHRTRSRPLAAGTVTMNQAAAFLGVQLLAGLGVLLQLNPYCMLVGLGAMPLVVLYPLAKRVTGWPQLVLGLTFNWGALVGWAAVHGSLYLPAVLPMYLGGVAWTLVYDTIYAHQARLLPLCAHLTHARHAQDKDDDLALGLKSTALTFGERSHTALTALSTAAVGGLALSGYCAGLGLPFFAVSVCGAAAHLAWQVGTVDYSSRASCMQRFVSNKWLGALVFGGIILDHAVSASSVSSASGLQLQEVAVAPDGSDSGSGSGSGDHDSQQTGVPPAGPAQV